MPHLFEGKGPDDTVRVWVPGCSTGYFFFQAEDGIRDLTVTGVQTCALPIFDVGGVGMFGIDSDGRNSRRIRDLVCVINNSFSFVGPKERLAGNIPNARAERDL